MTAPDPSSRQIGYCTNVHAGPDLQQTRHNLATHAAAVKRKFSPARPMGVGLWLAASAARQMRQPDVAEEFAEWLGQQGLLPFTLNGFPYGDFHRDVVKHDVYQPTWMDRRRVDYTLDLIAALDRLLPPGVPGSISTLPVAWGDVRGQADALTAAAQNLVAVAAELARLQQRSGRRICLCLEPEPGCLMDRSEHIISFFKDYLLPAGDEETVRSHLQVCHDVCHSAVMFEEQAHALQSYRAAGIGVGKVQVSAAVALPLEQLSDDERQAAVEQLGRFDEPRYLHQAVHRTAEGDEFFTDLEPALRRLADPQRRRGEVRVHFHVPVYLERFGHLHTTAGQIRECLAHLAPETCHFEVETYAWDVLPAELQQPTLADGIAAELAWFQNVVAAE